MIFTRKSQAEPDFFRFKQANIFVDFCRCFSAKNSFCEDVNLRSFIELTENKYIYFIYAKLGLIIYFGNRGLTNLDICCCFTPPQGITLYLAFER